MRGLDPILDNRQRFLDFVRSRVGDRQSAEDILQAAYARAIEKAGTLRSGDRLIPWFYRVLRNAITDRHRRVDVEVRALEQWRQDPSSQPATESRRSICSCVRAAMASLNPRYVHILNEVEVEGRRVADFATAEGLSAVNASVRLHRARRLLTARLLQICQSCADDACADCDCRGHSEV